MGEARPDRQTADPATPTGFQPTEFVGDGVALSDSLPPLACDDASPVPLLDGSTPDVLTDLDAAADGGPAVGPDAQATAAKPTLLHIGRYALKQRLAVGGLGAVYEAWDPLLSRTVAVKTLQFDVETPVRVSLDGLFLNEARLAAGLDHRGIVTVYDAGLSAHGVYIAMERLVGRDLREALAQGWKPSPSRAALLTRRVAEALAYAHARGVVHCDIKPANLFLTDKLRPKVLDFGIARAAGSAAPALEGLIAGSPHYLAPEQLRGGEVSERTDVYALGVVLYELLCGRKAFEGDSLEAITQAVLEAEVQPPHGLRPELSATLSHIVMRAMAREPAARYPSATAMALALRAWLGERMPAGASPAAAPTEAVSMSGSGPLPAAPRAALVGLPSAGGETATQPMAGLPLAAEHGSAGTGPTSAPRPLDGASRGATGKARARLEPARRALVAAGGLVIGGLLVGVAAVVVAVGVREPGGSRAPSAGPASGAASERHTAAERARSESAVPGAMAPGSTPTPTPATTLAVGAQLPAVDGALAERAARKPEEGSPPPAASGARSGTRTSRERAAAQKAAPAPAAAPEVVAVPAKGAVRFAISPWGHIDVNGTTVGTTPPMTQLMLPVGEHQVVVRNDAAPPFSTTIVVDAERPVVVRHRFAP